MPFDRISPSQMFYMRIATGLSFVAIGGGLGGVSASTLLGGGEIVTRLSEQAGGQFVFTALVFGVFLVNAGTMLLELVTPAPVKMSINVPFVAANFQTALAVGLVALAFAARHATLPGEVAPSVAAIQTLVFAGFALNLVFVMMTKMHWDYTENTGKALPKA